MNNKLQLLKSLSNITYSCLCLESDIEGKKAFDDLYLKLRESKDPLDLQVFACLDNVFLSKEGYYSQTILGQAVNEANKLVYNSIEIEENERRVFLNHIEALDADGNMLNFNDNDGWIEEKKNVECRSSPTQDRDLIIICRRISNEYNIDIWFENDIWNYFIGDKECEGWDSEIETIEAAFKAYNNLHSLSIYHDQNVKAWDKYDDGYWFSALQLFLDNIKLMADFQNHLKEAYLGAICCYNRLNDFENALRLIDLAIVDQDTDGMIFKNYLKGIIYMKKGIIDIAKGYRLEFDFFIVPNRLLDRILSADHIFDDTLKIRISDYGGS